MPVPHSDNMYSEMGHDGASVSGDNRDDALSPTDGYFHASGTSVAASSDSSRLYLPGRGHLAQQWHQWTSSNVPVVPKVLVEDPTLQADESVDKAKEAKAELERSMNNGSRDTSSRASYFMTHAEQAASGSTSASAHASSDANVGNATPPTHNHRRSVEGESSLLLTGHSIRLPSCHNVSKTTASARSSALDHASSQSRTHHQSHLDAPPAYSPSPSSPPSCVNFQGYQTFVPLHSDNTTDDGYDVDSDNMGLSEEHQALLPRQPQSMGGSPNGPPKSRWQRVKNATLSVQMRGKVKTLLGIAVFLSMFFAILGSVSLSSGGRSRHPKTPKVFDQDPVRQLKMGGERDLEWRPSDQCRNTPHKFDKTLSDITFDSGYTLSIEQRPERNSHRRGQTLNISGQVFVCLSGQDSKRGSVEIEIISNDAKLTADASINIEDDGKQVIKILTPHILDWWEYNGEAPCIQMRVTVHVPQNSYIDSLGLDVVHLDVELAEGLAMGAIDGPIIKTVVGNVNTPLAENIEDDNVVPYSLQSRRIVVQTVSGDIKGWFPLYDLLKVGSASGNVYVEVVPKPADKESARQAMLSVDSISGNVRIKEPLAFAVDGEQSIKKLPARDYVVKVETSSGNVHADVAMTSGADFQSASGDLTLKLLPLLTKGSERSDLRTETKSGTTTVDVLRPLEIHLGADEKTFMTDTEARKAADGPPLSELQTRHGSISGDIKLLYPSSWTGRFKAETISGGITAKGKDVKMTRSSRGIPKKVEGEKGKGNSFAHVGSISGDVELYVGEE